MTINKYGTKALIIKYEGEFSPYAFLEKKNIDYEIWKNVIYGEGLLIKIRKRNKTDLKRFFVVGEEIDDVDYLFVKLA
jgi:hypothetical protein